MVLTITAFILAVLFSALDYFFEIKPTGRLSTGTLIRLTFFFLVLVTGITDIIFKDASSTKENEEVLKKMDSTTTEIKKSIDSVKNSKNDTIQGKFGDN